MTVRELRAKYLAFFESKGHLLFPAASLIPYDATGRLDESLLFTGAGMVQFKPYFRGVAQPEQPRLMTCQRCVRTGDIEEVGDDSHLTFFEMLGNFSFGDYFQAQAISFSWEFMTSPEWLGLDPKRLTFTVFEEDDAAFGEWEMHILGAGLDPNTRIFRLGDETNYWPAGAFTKGPPGPCGPNSEMFYWVGDSEPPSGAYTKEDWIRDDAAGKWMEIWNDVFIQYEWQGSLRNPLRPSDGYVKEGMPPLPFRSIDTGMGLDRTAVVLGGYASVYDTDVFEPIFAVLSRLSSVDDVRARRIIADHIRTAAFCIMDGVLPSNTGRGYVLRRLIRRAVLQGSRKLGIKETFFYQVFDGVVESMGDFYTELQDKRETIVETLRNEEDLFRRTLIEGLYQFWRIVARSLHPSKSEKDITRIAENAINSDLGPRSEVVSDGERFVMNGAETYFLYETFGFPLEVTIELVNEFGGDVDLDGYDVALKEAQERSRGAQNRESVYGGVTGGEELSTKDAPATTSFLGYEHTESEGRIVRISGNLVSLDHTPFYAESGGQTGDQGTLTLSDGSELRVTNTTKRNNVWWHETQPAPTADLLGQVVIAKVTSPRRNRIRRNHTATHLLHAALRQILGTHVTQAGSYVGPDNLRFDFTHGKAMTTDELALVERIVNEQVLENTSVTTYVDIPISEARERGAMALFGEKYGDKVRMVEVGDFSRELCGGIHVGSTGEIGLFKIISESSAASGVRRIEAITGEGAYEWVLGQTKLIKDAANLLKSNPKDLVPAIERQTDALKEEKRKRERAEMASMSGSAKADEENLEIAAGVTLWKRNFGEADQKIAANALDNRASQSPNFVGVVAVANQGKVTFIAKAGSDAVAKGAHSGNLLREIAKIAGGGGGGKPDFATAGAKDPSKVDEALSAAPAVLARMLGVSSD